METALKSAWLVLAAIHIAPALVFFVPSLVQKLYEIPAEGTVGILIVHRGALFLVVVIAALFAAFDPAARRLASVLLAVSMIGFLFVYGQAGAPEGSLRTVAMVDLVALLPLALVGWKAWAR